MKSETSGTLRKLLIALLEGPTPQNSAHDIRLLYIYYFFNEAQCAAIGDEIYKAGEAKIGTDESVFNKYFCSLSPHELAAVSREYHKKTGHTILQAIDKEFSGDSKKALRTIVYATLSVSEYFSTRAHDVVKGLGTKDHLLIRVWFQEVKLISLKLNNIINKYLERKCMKMLKTIFQEIIEHSCLELLVK